MMKTNSNLLKRYLHFNETEELEENEEKEEKEEEKSIGSDNERRENKLSLSQELILEQQDQKKEKVCV